MKLTKEQQDILKCIKKSKDKFHLITGQAGTGKSFLIKAMFEELSKSRDILVTATTNKAKNNLIEALNKDDCYTTQSALGFVLLTDFITNSLQDKNEAKLADILIIDEVSMLQPMVLQKIIQTPYKQVVMFGDFSQLPPVGRACDFSSLDCKEYTLTKQLRQTENTLEDIFNLLRQSIASKTLLDTKLLEHRDIILYSTHKAFCEAYNQASQTKHILAYTNRVVDNYNSNIGKSNKFSLGDELILDRKIGQFANGDKVRITGLKELKDYFSLDLNGAETVSVYKTKKLERKALQEYYFKNDSFSKYKSSRICRPKHTYSLTIHKAQGTTIDNVFIDVSDIYSQLTKRVTSYSPSKPLSVPEYLRLLYVALSRMRKTAHLFVGGNREYKHLKGEQ